MGSLDEVILKVFVLSLREFLPFTQEAYLFAEFEDVFCNKLKEQFPAFDTELLRRFIHERHDQC